MGSCVGVVGCICVLLFCFLLLSDVSVLGYTVLVLASASVWSVHFLATLVSCFALLHLLSELSILLHIFVTIVKGDGLGSAFLS